MIRIHRPPCPNPGALATNYKHPDNKNALKNASYDKCMYCESKISHLYYGDVEHIQPKSVYVDLEFEWDNLGYVCARCNNSKGNTYDEETPFINPYKEEPSDALVALGTFLFPKLGNDQAKVTIYSVKLNRPGLLERRMEKIKRIYGLMDLHHKTNKKPVRQIIEEEIHQELEERAEYSFVAREAHKQFAVGMESQ